MRLTLLALLTCALLACAHRQAPPPPPAPSAPAGTEAEPFRLHPPCSLTLPVHFEAPVPVEQRLKNGARVWIWERHDLPLSSWLLVVPAGVDHEPPGKAGLAGLTSAMLTEGTQRRTSEKIADDLENLAIELWSTAGAESSMVGMNSLHETVGQGLDVFADVILHPAFRAADFQRVQRLALTELEQKKGVPEALASDAMSAKLYGPTHPWGQPSGGTLETVGHLKPKDLADFHRKIFAPGQALFVVVGDVTQAEVMKLLEEKFHAWNVRASPAPKLPPLPTLTGRTVTVLERPGSQTQLWLGGPLFPASSPDAIPARLSNLVLGGMFSSRLNQALREDKGYSYGFFSNVQLLRQSGVWLASGSVESRFIGPALQECLSQMERYAKEGPTEVELTRGRERYIGSLPGLFETDNATAGALATLAIHDLPADYFHTLPDKVAKTTRDDVLRINRQYLSTGLWPIVVVGTKPAP